MRMVPRSTALKIIYWNVVVAVLLVGMAGIAAFHRIHRFDKLIVAAGRQYGVAPRLVSALIWRESRFREHCVGARGEIGLMQVTETAAREWARATGVTDFERAHLFDPGVNIRAGTWYLARAIQRWSNRRDPLPFALAEYNAGRSNAQRWALLCGTDDRAFIERITYPTTRQYVQDILKRYRNKM